MKIVKAVGDYAEYKMGIEGVRSSSAGTYTHKLKKALLVMCGGEELKDLSEEDLSRYIVGLRGKQSIASQRLVVTTLKGFYDWYSKRHNKYNPARNMKAVREYVKHPDVLRLNDVERMINAAGRDNFMQMRNAAIIAILADTGIRVSELCELRMANISMEERQFLMTVPATKGNKTRAIPFCYREEGSMVAEVFCFYYLTVKFSKAWQPNDYLFQNTECYYLKVPGGWLEGRQRVNPGGKMNRSSIRKMLIRVAEQAGVERKVTPHSFRHFYATYLAVNKTDPILIQNRLGHASMDMTMRYLHYADIVTGDSAKDNPMSKVKTGFKGAVKALKSVEKVMG